MHSRSNDIISGVLHAIGAGLAVTALVLLIVFASGAASVATKTIFGSGMVLLYLASASYHLLPLQFVRAKTALRKIDHAMIYVLIAATYTPIGLLGLRGAWGWSLFSVSWSLALLGILSKTIPALHPPHWLSTLHYLLMGWLVVLAWPVLVTQFTGGMLFWLALGGMCYTSGVVFYSLDKKIKLPAFGMHEIFHVFVLAGSFCHFWLMLWFL